ncbi:MAG: hypothetical protein HC842_04305 [Cytophagales bacterium]|nr:hypothetical protein [Cytophagales bacterium]
MPVEVKKDSRKSCPEKEPQGHRGQVGSGHFPYWVEQMLDALAKQQQYPKKVSMYEIPE